VSEDYEVGSNTDGGWDVTADGVSRASSHHQTQDAARGSQALAENAGGGEVCINGRAGQIRNPHDRPAARVTS